MFEDFNRDSFDGWYLTGDAFGDRPTRPAIFDSKRPAEPARLVPLAAGQAHSGMFSDRLRGVLRSRSFTIESRYIHWLVAGRGGRINVVVDGFEKIRDPIYGGLTRKINFGDRASVGHAGPGHVAGPLSLSGNQRWRDRRLRWGQCTGRRRRWANRGRRNPDVESARAGTFADGRASRAGGTPGPEINLAAAIADLKKTGRAPQAQRLAAAIAEARRSTPGSPNRPWAWQLPMGPARTSISTFEEVIKTWASSSRAGSWKSWAARIGRLTTLAAGDSSWRDGWSTRRPTR